MAPSRCKRLTYIKCLLALMVVTVVFLLYHNHIHTVEGRRRIGLQIQKILPVSIGDAHIQETQMRRKQQIRRVCDSTPLLETKDKKLSQLHNTLSHILVDDNHRVLYCFIPKTGCTFWKERLIRFSPKNKSPKIGSVHDDGHLYRNGIRKLSNYSSPEIIFRLKTYYKFMFTRHPLTRLVSAFRDKFTGERDGFFAYIPKMLNYTRKLKTKIAVKNITQYNFTFVEFLQYMFHPKDTSFKFNEHWNNLESICSPCFINYDFIGKQETFNNDVNYLLKTLFKHRASRITAPNWTGTDGTLTRKYFASVPADVTSKVLDFFQRDSELFGYDLQVYLS